MSNRQTNRQTALDIIFFLKNQRIRETLKESYHCHSDSVALSGLCCIWINFFPFLTHYSVFRNFFCSISFLGSANIFFPENIVPHYTNHTTHNSDNKKILNQKKNKTKREKKWWEWKQLLRIKKRHWIWKSRSETKKKPEYKWQKHIQQNSVHGFQEFFNRNSEWIHHDDDPVCVCVFDVNVVKISHFLFPFSVSHSQTII